MKISRQKFLFSIVSIFFIGLLWGFQYYTTVNIPWWDDFHGIILPVFELFGDSSVYEKAKLFFSLNNEHRVVNDRFFMLLIYLATSTFQMKTLAMLGFVNLILIYLLLLKIAKPFLLHIFHFLPVLFLIFQAQYFESLQSLMVPFQNFSVIFYVLLSFYSLIYFKKNAAISGFLWGILAFFSHGNGILALLIGSLILVFQKYNTKAIIWIIGTLLIVYLYFLGYHKPSANPSISALDHPIEAIRYVFEFLGAYALNLTNLSTTATKGSLRVLLPTFTGILSVLSLGFVFLKKYPLFTSHYKAYISKLRHSKIDLFLLSAILFFLATALLIGITRTGFPMVSRYTINSALTISLIYLFVLNNIKNKAAFCSIISVGTFTILLLSYFNSFEIAVNNKNNAIFDGINWQKNKTWVVQYSNPDHTKLLNKLLLAVYESGKYVFPKNNLEIPTNIEPDKLEKVELRIENGGSYLKISDKVISNSSTGIYYLFLSENQTYLFPGLPQKNNIFQFLQSGQYYSNSISTTFCPNLLPVGLYKIIKVETSSEQTYPKLSMIKNVTIKGAFF
jgi:hypothetical protein